MSQDAFERYQRELNEPNIDISNQLYRIGISGDLSPEQYREILKPYLSAQDPMVRSRAVEAYVWRVETSLALKQARSALVDTDRSEDWCPVRRQAISILRRRPVEDTVAVELIELALADPSGMVTWEAMDILAETEQIPLTEAMRLVTPFLERDESELPMAKSIVEDTYAALQARQKSATLPKILAKEKRVAADPAWFDALVDQLEHGLRESLAGRGEGILACCYDQHHFYADVVEDEDNIEIEDDFAELSPPDLPSRRDVYWDAEDGWPKDFEELQAVTNWMARVALAVAMTGVKDNPPAGAVIKKLHYFEDHSTTWADIATLLFESTDVGVPSTKVKKLLLDRLVARKEHQTLLRGLWKKPVGATKKFLKGFATDDS